MAYTRVETSGLTVGRNAVETSCDVDPLMEFLPENEISPAAVEAGAQEDSPLGLPAGKDLSARSWRWPRVAARRASVVPFGCGVAVGVFVALFLPVRSVPDTAVPPHQPAPPVELQGLKPLATIDVGPTALNNAVAQPAKAVVDAPEGGGTVGTAGGREPAAASAPSGARPERAMPPALRSAQRPQSPALAIYRGSLAVNSVPKGAQVSLNGRRVGTTPLVMKDVPVGSRSVRVELDGYRPWSSTVRVVANQRVSTTSYLQPESDR